MSTLSNLQQAYVDGLKTITGKSTSRRVSRQKKTDERPISAFTLYDPSLGDKQAFPVTREMLFFSFVFWGLLVYLSYLGITYGLLYGRITKEADLSDKCSTDFFKDGKLDNAAKVENYPIGDAGPYLIRLHSDKLDDVPMEFEQLPPFVTGVSSAQFYEVQGLTHHLNEDLKSSGEEFKLYIYDLGLNSKEREILERHCNCEVRDFEFDKFPVHVHRVSNFAWRPILLQLMLEEFGSVVYVDPMTRFKNPNSLNFLRRRGSKDYFLWDPLKFVSLIAYTDVGMFQYLNESRCVFTDSSLLIPEAIVLYRTQNTWKELMKPWLKCALSVDCIAPVNARYSGCIEVRQPKTTGCHRYDMSALSIILNRGVQYTIDREKMVSFRLTYTAQEQKDFFPEQPWTYTQILLLIFTPVAAYFLYKFLRRRRLFRR